MSIFAISDLHLSLNSDKPMNVFGPKWDNYVERMEDSWNNVVKTDDLVLIPGDISWAMYLEDTKADLAYIDRLNGKKLLLRGNHDYWWTTLNKMEKFVEENGFKTIRFLKNKAFFWGDTAICGTRGWTIAKVNSSDEDKKIYERERQRLLLSLEDAAAVRTKKIIAAMHYPPVEQNSVDMGFMDILKGCGVNECVFGHLHASAQKFAPCGIWDGIKLRLVSCDYLNFTPLLIEK